MNFKYLFIIILVIKLIYSSIISKIADKQRLKPLPEEVSDIYDNNRYQTYLNYVADNKKLSNIFKLINLLINVYIFLFSNLFAHIELLCGGNPYKIVALTYLIVWFILGIVEAIESYIDTFKIEEKYGLNKKDMKEFIKDLAINLISSLVLETALYELIVYLGEHMVMWTNNFTVPFKTAVLICLGISAVIGLVLVVIMWISYFLLRLQYTFTPLEDGDLKNKINELQAASKKKVKYMYVYNESKKSTSKNAFLLKVLWRKEFGIADNFLDGNSEDELFGVMSHEIGHLMHKKNILNFISYSRYIFIFAFAAYSIYNPFFFTFICEGLKDSFGLTSHNYYLIFLIVSELLTPIFFLVKVYENYRSRVEEYEADRNAVKNGYGEALIRTFKNLSSDELINVNPHPFIEFTEYNHPGMYQRIKAINNEITKVAK